MGACARRRSGRLHRGGEARARQWRRGGGRFEDSAALASRAPGANWRSRPRCRCRPENPRFKDRDFLDDCSRSGDRGAVIGKESTGANEGAASGRLSDGLTGGRLICRAGGADRGVPGWTDTPEAPTRLCKSFRSRRKKISLGLKRKRKSMGSSAWFCNADEAVFCLVMTIQGGNWAYISARDLRCFTRIGHHDGSRAGKPLGEAQSRCWTGHAGDCSYQDVPLEGCQPTPRGETWREKGPRSPRRSRRQHGPTTARYEPETGLPDRKAGLLFHEGAVLAVRTFRVSHLLTYTGRLHRQKWMA